MHTII